MKGSSHLVIGMSTYAALALRGIEGVPVPQSGLGASEWSLLASLAVVGVGSLLPDLDQRQATLSRRLATRPVSEVVSRVVHHRGPTHSLLAVVAVWCLAAAAGAAWGLVGVAGLMAWGYSLHLLADMGTRAGVPLLWPLPGRFGLLPIRTGSDTIFERLTVAAVVVAAVGHVIWPHLVAVSGGAM